MEIPERMADISQRPGVQVEALTEEMENLARKLSAMCHETEDIRKSVEKRIVALNCYLPLNSKEGMEFFFPGNIKFLKLLSR